MTVLYKSHQSGCRTGKGDGGKLSEVNARAMTTGQNELIDEFKMAAGEVISIKG